MTSAPKGRNDVSAEEAPLRTVSTLVCSSVSLRTIFACFAMSSRYLSRQVPAQMWAGASPVPVQMWTG
jgi:hypothetical protein